MSLWAAILGFLDLEETSGYTLKQRFEGSVESFCTVTQSQIYRELHALERARLVLARTERGRGKPDRKLYGLTDRGRDELRRWLEQPLEPMQLRHPLLLKFVFSAGLAPALLDDVLRRYEEGVERSRGAYTARLGREQIFELARSQREREIWALAIQHGIAWCDTELAWVRAARKRLMQSSKKTARTRRTTAVRGARPK